jgi:hypothetical protein
MRFVGDPHIGKMSTIMGDDVGLRRQTRLLRGLLKSAKRDGCTHACILGDLFHGPHPVQEELVAVIKTLAATELEVIVYLGNHDVDDNESNSFRLLRELPEAGALKHVTFVEETTTLRIDGARVKVVPWKKRYSAEDFSGRYDLLLFHDGVVGAKGDNGRPFTEGHGIPRASIGDSIAVSGHLHTPQRVGTIHYPGTPVQTSFGEKLPKRVSTATWSGGVMKIREEDFDPPWVLEHVVFDPASPPKCDAAGTLYTLDVSKGAPGSRWLLDHPKVVRVNTGTKRKSAEVSKVVELTQKSEGADDSELLTRFLRSHTSLSQLQRARAVKIDRKLGTE